MLVIYIYVNYMCILYCITNCITYYIYTNCIHTFIYVFLYTSYTRVLFQTNSSTARPKKRPWTVAACPGRFKGAPCGTGAGLAGVGQPLQAGTTNRWPWKWWFNPRQNGEQWGLNHQKEEKLRDKTDKTWNFDASRWFYVGLLENGRTWLYTIILGGALFSGKHMCPM